MARIGVVSDSTCDLGLEWLAEHDVEVVPLKVQIGDETFLDWVDLTPTQFYERHRNAAELPTTSQPTPADFSEAYERAAAKGVEGILVVTVTSALSGTFQSAEIAAKEASLPVRVVDSRMVSAATGLVVKAAVEARDAGATLDEAFEAADWTVKNTRIFFVLDTLEYLVKGGRAGRAQGLAASVLNIKPILTFAPEGVIEPFKKAKGLNKAFAMLAETVGEAAAENRLKIAFLHGDALDLVERVKSAVDAVVPDYEYDATIDIGSVIGNYAGSGAVAVAYVPAQRP